MTESRGKMSLSFVLHGLAALGALWALNFLIATQVPVAIQGIGASYWVFFYHFGSALNSYLFFGALLVFSIRYLRSNDERFDQCARVAAELGVLALAITVVTGAAWARGAWNRWWVWDDPRLMSASITLLVYIGYLMLQYQVENPTQRRRWAAVMGILAFANIPFVHYATKIFATGSHPANLDMADSSIIATRWFAVLAFGIFFWFLYRWKLDRDRVHDDVQRQLGAVRRLEEGKYL